MTPKFTDNFDENENFELVFFDAERACDAFNIAMTEFMTMVRDPENAGMRIQDLFEMAFDAKWKRLVDKMAKTEIELMALKISAKEFGMIQFDGVWYKNKSDLIKRNNVAATSVANYMDQGQSLEEAVRSCLANKREKVDLSGTEFETKQACLRHYGLNANFINTVMSSQGVDFAEAVRQETEGFVFYGYKFPSSTVACRLLGISSRLLKEKRKQFPKSTDVALLEAFRSRNTDQTWAKRWKIDENLYSCPWHACVAYGIDPLEFDVLVKLNTETEFSEVSEEFFDLYNALEGSLPEQAWAARKQGLFLYQLEENYERSEKELADFEMCDNLGLVYDIVLHSSLFKNCRFESEVAGGVH